MSQNERGEELLLVDKNDNPVGFETKLRAHQNGGKLHRAFSILVFDSAGKMLLQRRAKKKYHFGGLWTNACCGHPRREEKLPDAAHRRLREEFGFAVEMQEVFAFVYRASDTDSGLTEYEFDHVYCGRFDGQPQPNPDEIDEYKWVDLAELAADMKASPYRYTPWFKIAVDRVIENLSGSRTSVSPFLGRYDPV